MDFKKEHTDSILFLKQKQLEIKGEILFYKALPGIYLHRSNNILRLQYELECLETLTGIVKHSYSLITEPIDLNAWQEDDDTLKESM